MLGYGAVRAINTPMTRTWNTINSFQTDDGLLQLLKRDEDDFIIKIDNKILMNSKLSLTEEALAVSACEPIADRAKPRVLIGGLGMGFTLRAALDALPSDARVVVAELNSVIVDWCRGPLAELTQKAVDERRVKLEITDVALLVEKAAKVKHRYDAIVLDLYEGTHAASKTEEDPFYGPSALERTRKALNPGGILTVWTEEPDEIFEKRAKAVGFDIEKTRPGKGGPRHVVYVATVARKPVR